MEKFKEWIKEIALYPVLVLLCWFGGVVLAEFGHPFLGCHAFFFGTITLALGLIGSFPTSENRKRFWKLLIRAGLLVFLFGGVRSPLEKIVNYHFVHDYENPRIAQEVSEIVSDPAKIKVLQDFYAGKLVSNDEIWFALDGSTNRLAIRRILGLDQTGLDDFYNRFQKTRLLYYRQLVPLLVEQASK